MKDIHCIRTDWINLGREQYKLELCLYEDRDEKYVSIEGVPYQNPMCRAGYLMKRVQDSPTYLLEPSNRVIGDVLGRAFEPLALPSTQVTLSWVLELLRIDIALQNKLNQDPDAVNEGLIEAIQTNMLEYSSFVKVKKSLSIFIILWEKTFCCSCFEFLDEFR